MTIVVRCKCGKTFRVKDELAGKRGKCTECGNAISIPSRSPSMGPPKLSPASMQSCPECHQPMPANAVICVSCGLDLRTGNRIPAAVVQEPVTSSERVAGAAGGTFRSRSRNRRLLVLGITTGVAVLAVAVVYLVNRPKAPVAASRPGGESPQVADAGAAPANANAPRAPAQQQAQRGPGPKRLGMAPDAKAANALDRPRVVLGMSDGSPALFADLISGMTISLTGVKYDHNARIESYEAHISLGGTKPFVVRVGRKGSIPPGQPAEYVAAIDGKPIPLLDDSNVVGLIGIALKDFGGVVFPNVGSIQIPAMVSTTTYDENGRPQLATQEFTIDGMMYVIAYSNHSRDENARASGYVVHVHARPGNTPPKPPVPPGGQIGNPMAPANPTQDNPLVAAKALPKEPRPGRIVRNAQAMNGINGGSTDKWQGALESATGDKIERADSFLFLTDFNRLYDKNAFREAESAKLLERLALVPPDQITAWEASLTKSVGTHLIPPLPSRSAALVVIIQQDALFHEGKFDWELSNLLSGRVATIPRTAIDAMNAAAGQNSAMEDTDAALAIAKYDALFVGTTFQENVWQQLLQNQQGHAPGGPNLPNPAAGPAKAATNLTVSIPAELVPKSQGTLIDIGTLPEYFFGRINRRQDKWDKAAWDQAVDDWREAVQSATKEHLDLATLISFLMQFDPLWANDTFQPAESERYVARIKRLLDDDVVKWQSVLKVGNSSLSKVETVGYMLHFDRLYVGDAFQPAESDRLLARVNAIPPQSVKTWDEAIDGSALQAVLGLAGNDSMFDERNMFLDPVAQQVLAALRQRNDLILKRPAK